jgi:hypothetical protein
VEQKGHYIVHFSILKDFNSSSFQFVHKNDGMGLMSTFTLDITKQCENFTTNFEESNF